MSRIPHADLHGHARHPRIFLVKPHRKVRSGCAECKSRRVKCDERRPQCSMCIRYSVPCAYPTVHEALPKDISCGTTDLPLRDLELLHHWTTFAYLGFGDKLGDEKPWQVEMPAAACEQPFLMRGILALSALHISRVRPEQREKYLMRAVYHQNKALPSYRYIIDNFRNKITEKNYLAVVGFASLTSVYAFMDSGSIESKHSQELSLSTGVPEWFRLLRGTRRIVDVGKNWVRNGPLAYHVRSVDGVINLAYNPDDSQLAALEVLFDSRDTACNLSLSEVEAYLSSLRLLRESFAIPLMEQPNLGIKFSIFRWVELVPQLYLQLLGELRPGSLILLAYLCILIRRAATRCWYMEGSAERLISSIESALDEKWKRWIAWPLNIVNSPP